MSRYFDFSGYNLSDLTAESLEGYLVHGYQPGGFMTHMLIGDLYGAVARADRWNINLVGQIVQWIRNNAPEQSYGSEANFRCWLGDANGCRTRWVEQREKSMVWATLNDTAA